jgi:heme oxygenase
MGIVAKRLLGQLSRKSLETESANILKTSKANKIPGSLSLALDGTLKQSHDMRAFGLGTLATMATLDRYKRFTSSMHHVYSTMENELDQTTESSEALVELWKRHGGVLRRSDALYHDLQDVTTSDELAIMLQQQQQQPTPSTRNYVTAIREAGARDRENQGATLIGHMYCRYFADLFGGQMLASPYKMALGLDSNTPRHYTFDITNRREFIETLYRDINTAGEILTEAQKKQVVDEALTAFRHNIHVYTEEPVSVDAMKGGINVVIGFGKSLFMSNKS